MPYVTVWVEPEAMVRDCETCGNARDDLEAAEERAYDAERALAEVLWTLRIQGAEAAEIMLERLTPKELRYTLGAVRTGPEAARLA